MYPALAPLHVDAPYWHGEDELQDVLLDAWQPAVDVKQYVLLDAYEYWVLLEDGDTSFGQ